MHASLLLSLLAHPLIHTLNRDVKAAIYDMVRLDGKCITERQGTPGHPRPIYNSIAISLYLGYTTLDVAPFYGQVERWLGDLRSKIENPYELDMYKIFTKLVFPPIVESLSAKDVENQIDASLLRLRTQRLDLVQLHW